MSIDAPELGATLALEPPGDVGGVEPDPAAAAAAELSGGAGSGAGSTSAWWPRASRSPCGTCSPTC